MNKNRWKKFIEKVIQLIFAINDRHVFPNIKS